MCRFEEFKGGRVVNTERRAYGRKFGYRCVEGREGKKVEMNCHTVLRGIDAGIYCN
jgi:hypothetical protein